MKEIKTRQDRWRDRPCSWIGKPFTKTVIQIYALTSKSEEAEWRPKTPSRINIPKIWPLHYRGLECKSRKSRNTWSNRQICSWSTKQSSQRITGFCQENMLVITNTLFQQHKRILYTWTSPDGQYWYQIDYILCGQRWRSSTQSAKARLGTDCCSDHELLITKFRLQLKKVGKTTGPFRYDRNQIPYG